MKYLIIPFITFLLGGWFEYKVREKEYVDSCKDGVLFILNGHKEILPVEEIRKAYKTCEEEE